MSDEEACSGLSSQFCNACEFVRKHNSLFDSNGLLQFYALYKQATEGDCTKPKPGFFDFQGKAKWEAWKGVRSTGKEEAMNKYVNFLTTTVPNWDKENEENCAPGQGKSSDGGLGVSVSTMSNTDTDIADENKTVFDWCKEDNVEQICQCLSSQVASVSDIDDNGMTLLHWACDRGLKDMAIELINRGADLNARDMDEQTPLHYAVCCEHKEVVEVLLQGGADISIEDSEGQTPYQLETSTDILSLFNSIKTR